jgi:UDP-GlcNAc:undecaprenyl-phosphate/decaprenyl-phosphate GlcNAc-1-phosphate transferase
MKALLAVLGPASLTICVSFLFAVGLIPLTIRLARRWDLVDHPNVRKVHSGQIPLLGGLAIYLAALTVLFVMRLWTPLTIALVLACGVAVVMGILDDRFDIPSRYRLAVHFVLAGFLVAMGFRTTLLPFWLDAFISLFWIAGMINAINCMDCADGILGGIGALTLGSFAILLAAGGQPALALCCLAFAGASVGFLFYNFPPARIFMGDSGSTALGLLVGAVSLRAVQAGNDPFTAWLALLPLTLPVGDILLVHVRRYRYGIRQMRHLLASTGKDHLPHRLLSLGFSNRCAAICLYLLTTGLCVAPIISHAFPLGAFAMCTVTVVFVVRLEQSYRARFKLAVIAAPSQTTYSTGHNGLDNAQVATYVALSQQTAEHTPDAVR